MLILYQKSRMFSLICCDNSFLMGSYVREENDDWCYRTGRLLGTFFVELLGMATQTKREENTITVAEKCFQQNEYIVEFSYASKIVKKIWSTLKGWKCHDVVFLGRP